ncbi:hypothetical protein ABZ766_32000 [Streptomyces sp. NPDC006670]|uniref:hypothetical protein n=1 Tax=Streptomyces sp. NPDC006670 TaxID=3154476 RepID=UPI0033E171BD
MQLTEAKVRELREELDYLKRVKRPKLLADIAEAREAGDLTNSPGGQAVQEKWELVEARIQEIEAALAKA